MSEVKPGGGERWQVTCGSLVTQRTQAAVENLFQKVWHLCFGGARDKDFLEKSCEQWKKWR